MSYRISPMQRGILFVLEEAGEENLPTILNTLVVSSSSNARLVNNIDLRVFADELLKMLRQKLVEISETNLPKDPETLFIWLSEFVTLNDELIKWTPTKNTSPVISLTELGKEFVS